MANERHAPGNVAGVFGDTLGAGMRLAGARYTLKRLLGRGPASQVWLAWDRQLEQEVALKFLPPELLENPAVLDELRQQARTNLKLIHPAIARMFDFVPDHQRLAIAMEYVDGWSLAALKVDRPEQRYRPEEVRPWLRQLCAALDYANHELYLIHRDLKPSNLLLSTHEQLKVTDFAIAQTVRSTLAQRGAPVSGIDPYMSPQQAAGEEASVLDDVYALGATIYDLLTGTPPFDRGQAPEPARETAPPTMTARLAELGIRDTFPAAWEETVAACLAKDPAKRPQSAGEVFESLERAAAPKPVEAPQSEAASESPAGEPAPGEGTRPTGVEPAAQVSESETIGVTDETPESPVAAGAAPAPEPSEAPPEPELVPAPEQAEGETVATPGERSPPASPAVPALLFRSKWTELAGVAALTLLAFSTAVWFATHWRSGSDARSMPRPGRGGQVGGLPGSLDASFNPGLGANDEVRAIVVQPDGRILAGGRFKEFDGAAIAGLVRLSLDGRLEKTFVPQPQGNVLALALQPDGRVLLGGDFTTVGGEPRRRIARLLPDGTLDRSFDARGVLNREVRALALQPDGKILVGGSFDAAPAHKRLTRLNADGTRDPTFNPGAGASRIVWALALEPDGKILAGGDFTSFNGQTSGRLVRLLADGARDTSFDIGTGANNTVSAVYVQDDGKILVGGRFTTINGVPAGHVARLNPDGSLDSEFNAGTGVDGSVRSFAAQHSGKILIGGTFASVQGVPRNRVARLDANGAVDTSFDPGEGAVDGDLWRLALQTDRSLVIAGGFRSFNGVDCGRMARLNLGPAPGAR